MNRIQPLILLGVLCFLPVAAAQEATLSVVEENGTRAQQINIVFLAEGYTAGETAKFDTDVDNAIGYLFSREPWKEYRSYCNVYSVFIASNESGTDNGTAGGERDTYFDSGFNTPSVSQLLTIDGVGQSRGYMLLNAHLPEYDMPVMLVNDPKYGGSGGSISVASTHASSALLVEHEIGHSFAGLADEYDYNYLIYTPVESYNATQQSSRETVRWRSWIEESTPVPTPETSTYDDVVGVFEGANYRTDGWFRPHNNSVMRNLGRPIGSVNREKFVLSYYQKIGPVDAFSPTDPTLDVPSSELLEFSITPKVPSEGPALQVQWEVNGEVQPAATESSFSIASSSLGNGTHSITAVLHDPTPFVRDDPSGLLREEVAWTVTVSGQLPATLAEWRNAFGPDGSNPSGDGLNNLVKYALGLDPNLTADPSEKPWVEITEVSSSERYLTMVIPRTVKRQDVEYQVRAAGDVGSWQSGAGHTEVMEDTDAMLKVRDAVSVEGAPARFIEFSVTEE